MQFKIIEEEKENSPSSCHSGSSGDCICYTDVYFLQKAKYASSL